MNAVDPERRPASDAEDEPAAEAQPKSAFSVKRLAPLGVLALGFALFFAFDLDRYVTFQALNDHREALVDFVDQQGILAILAFIVIYAVSTALSLPGGAVLTVTGGFLFGTWFGTLYAVIGATAGAIAVFLIAKTSLGDMLRAKAGPALRKMEAGFRENALSYLLVLRLIPLFPFFLVNIVPAFLGVPLRTYALATFFGIIPGAFVFASVGAGIGSVFEQMDPQTEGAFDPASVLTPQVITALVGLAVLSLLPVAYKKFKGRKPGEAGADQPPG